MAALQVPKGAGPAATVTVVDCGGMTGEMLKLKGVPAVTPAPATLQTCSEPLLQDPTETMLLSSVTAPVSATTLPSTPAPVSTVTLASAKIVPRNWVPVPRVAELPTWKNTLQSAPPAGLIMITDELLPVTSELPIRKIKTALGLF
jgi:hypothetical protein